MSRIFLRRYKLKITFDFSNILSPKNNELNFFYLPIGEPRAKKAFGLKCSCG
jgi:hypothetical protein